MLLDNRGMNAGESPSVPVSPQAQNSQTDMNSAGSGLPDATVLEASWRAAHATVLEAYVELLRSQEGLIPEMVSGSSLADVQASVTLAKAAYQRMVQQLAARVATEGVAGPATEDARPLTPAFSMGAGGGSRLSGLNGGMEQQQGKRPDPVALVAQYYSSGTPRR